MKEFVIFLGFLIMVLGIMFGAKWYTKLVIALIGLSILILTMLLTMPDNY